VIVDDTAHVWPGHASNLVTVERYCYFPNSAKQFGYKRRSLLEDNRSPSPLLPNENAGEDSAGF